MIKKVLIAEDHQSANLSLQKTLEELGINDLDYVYYCDDALIKIRKAVHTNQPYDLLITDLGFDDNGEKQQLTGGEALIAAARAVQPHLTILVFSAENKPAVIDHLYNKLEIDGYVRKARNDIKELKTAIGCIANNQRYYPRPIAELVKQKNAHEFTKLDITIIALMIDGKKLQEIPDLLKSNNLQPSSLSSVEKRLNHIKEVLDFSSNEQLVAHCVKMGIV
jgi:two-component system capsular synthesis response regulator RcsB